MKDKQGNLIGVSKFIAELKEQCQEHDNGTISDDEVNVLFDMLEEDLLWQLSKDNAQVQRNLKEKLQELILHMPGEIFQEDPEDQMDKEHVDRLRKIHASFPKNSKLAAMISEEHPNAGNPNSEEYDEFRQSTDEFLQEIPEMNIHISDNVMGKKINIDGTKICVDLNQFGPDYSIENEINDFSNRLPDLKEKTKSRPNVTWRNVIGGATKEGRIGTDVVNAAYKAMNEPDKNKVTTRRQE